MPRSTEVHKFGGTSVGSAERILAACELISRAATDVDVAVVSSAMAGTTDRLVQITGAGHVGRQQRGEAVAWIRDQHERAVEDLGLSGAGAADRVRGLLEELDTLVAALNLLAVTPPAMHDRVHSIGERLAVELIAGTLEKMGTQSKPCSADAFLETSGMFGEADPMTFRADARTAAALRSVIGDGVIPIVTGFFGQGPDGDIRLLGRGGSDLSASLLASAIDADKLVIWTDVAGVYTADPRLVPEARVIGDLSYREAGEMAYFGSKVLHPRTMIPVIEKDIPIEVRSSIEPDAGGTLIRGAGSSKDIAVSVIRDVTLIGLEGAGMAGVAGVSARMFGALADAGVSVILISQSSSEASITVAVRNTDSDAAVSAIRNAFRLDLARGLVQQVTERPDLAVITAVGSKLNHRVGAAASIMGACARAKINILAITQGSSELSVSIVVEGQDVQRAARAVHDRVVQMDSAWGDGAEPTCVLVGLGNVGRAVAHELPEEARIAAVADSSGYLVFPSPVGPKWSALTLLLQRKAAGRRIADEPGAVAGGSPAELIDRVHELGVPSPVVIDCTAEACMRDVAEDAIDRGIDYIAANKHVHIWGGCGGDWDNATMFGRSMLLGEATVGAGLPVTSTIHALCAGGDEIVRVHAALSGTMAYVIDRVAAGEPLRAAVERAIELGYAEPDPSADLGGMDLLRKAIILGALTSCGRYFGDPADLTPEPLVGLVTGGPIGPQLDAADAGLREWVIATMDGGKSPRYIAQLDATSADQLGVGPMAIDSAHPFFGIPASNAAIAFWTRRQGEVPIVISGPGAGAMQTAGGVLADLARLRDIRATVPIGGVL